MPVTRPNAIPAVTRPCEQHCRSVPVRAGKSPSHCRLRPCRSGHPLRVPRLVHGVPVGWSDPHRTRKTDREGQPASRAAAVRKGWLYLTIVVAKVPRVAPRAASGMKMRGMRQFLAGNVTGRGPDPGSRGIYPADRTPAGSPGPEQHLAARPGSRRSLIGTRSDSLEGVVRTRR